MNTLVVTNCSNRKASTALPCRLMQEQVASWSVAQVAESWGRVLQTASSKQSAVHLYCGRAMTDAKWVAAQTGGSLSIVSAGLGVIGGSDLVPNYDATVSDRRNWLGGFLNQTATPSSVWWKVLCESLGRSSSLVNLLQATTASTKLVAMPASYLAMIKADLAEMPDSALNNVYIFTSPAGQRELPARLQPHALPYDGRLDGIAAFSGTQTDFPQRAMRHFVSHVLAERLTISLATASVENCLRPLEKPARPTRARLDDSQIKDFLRGAWTLQRGESSRLLSHLRKGAGIACEQGRFRTLWKEVREEMLSSQSIAK